MVHHEALLLISIRNKILQEYNALYSYSFSSEDVVLIDSDLEKGSACKALLIDIIIATVGSAYVN